MNKETKSTLIWILATIAGLGLLLKFGGEILKQTAEYVLGK
jgi:hypothetical protein